MPYWPWAIDVVVPFVESYAEDAERDDEFAGDLMLRHGIPEDLVIALRSVSRSFRAWGSPAQVTRPLRDGESLVLRDRHAHRHRLAPRQALDQVHRRAGLAAADLEDQARGALDAVDVVGEVDAALEAVAGVAREVVAARAPGDRLGEKERRLEEEVARRGLGLGGLPAHDAAQADRAGVVGDAQHRGVDAHFLAVQQQAFLAVPAPAHVDGAAQLVQVVDVQRPAELEHDVVGDVDQRRDAALARALEAPAHPLRRRRRGVHVADHAPGEPAAALRIRDPDGVPGFVPRLDPLYRELLQPDPGKGRHLSCDAQHRQAVPAVRREREGEHVLVERERPVDVGAGLRIPELEQSRVILGEPELSCGAQHAVAFHASKG